MKKRKHLMSIVGHEQIRAESSIVNDSANPLKRLIWHFSTRCEPQALDSRKWLKSYRCAPPLTIDDLALMSRWSSRRDASGRLSALVTSYCFVREAVDLWKRRFVWGTLGIATGVLILACVELAPS
jgi:hypothetical protein